MTAGHFRWGRVEVVLGPLLHNYSGILANRDTLLVPIRLEEVTLENLLVFLQALTDDRARDLIHVIPDGVPSGLPIDRMHCRPRSGGLSALST